MTREADVLELAAERLATLLVREMRGIVPERVYSREDAAELLSMDRPKTLAEFPPEVLPAVPLTPGGRRVGYYGRDLIRFIRERRDPKAPPIEDVA